MEEQKRIITNGNIILIKPLNWVTPTVDCGICGAALRDQADITSSEKFDCCTDCRDTVVWPNLKKWKQGWRPAKSISENKE